MKKSTWTIFKIVFLGVAYLEEIQLDHLQRMSGELEEQAAALEALKQLSFDPQLLSEINSIVDEAQKAGAIQMFTI